MRNISYQHICRKIICIFLFVVFFVSLVGCKSLKITEKNQMVEDQEYSTHCNYMFIMAKYLIIFPEYFEDLYGVGTKFRDALDNWEQLNYSDAFNNFYEVEDALLESDIIYFPDDMAIIRLPIGLLALENGLYDLANDYLISAYVISEAAYTSNQSYFATMEAVSLSIIQYYYAMGDYNSCLQEIDRLRDIDVEISSNYEIDKSVFINNIIEIMINKSEALIYSGRGNYEEALKK